MVEVVTLKDPVGAERYRELRRVAGQHLPVPCVLLEGRLVSPGIPEQDELRRVLREELAPGAHIGPEEEPAAVERPPEETQQ